MQAHLLAATHGVRLVVYHPARRPLEAGRDMPALLFLPAFAEEMNKARHVVNQAARELAAAGVAVALLDPLGCGDSSGDFGDATWAHWEADAQLAHDWLKLQGHRRIGLWGMRLGAVLAAEAAQKLASSGHPPWLCLMWQPVLQGDTHLTQFLRLRLAGGMLAQGGAASAQHPAETTKSLRQRLSAGESIEVAGYTLSARLAEELSGLNLTTAAPACDVQWLEVVAESGRELPAPTQRLLARWSTGTRLELTSVVGEPFWASNHATELVQCPELVQATVQSVVRALGHEALT